MAKWTDATIKALPTPEKHPKRHREQSPDPTLKGFGIQITPKGKRTFFVSYTSPTATDGEGNAKRRFLDLGTYPATALTKAREKCREARTALEAGIDPIDARDADREARRQAASRQKALGTVADLFALYVGHLEDQGKRSAREVRRIYDRAIAPLIGEKKAKDVTPDDMTEVLAGVLESARQGGRGSGHTLANRTRSYMRAAFQLGREAARNPNLRGKAPPFEIAANPVEDVGKAAKREAPRQRWLSPEELRAFWNGLGEPYTVTYTVSRRRGPTEIIQTYQTDPVVVLALKWMIATGQRVEEVIGAEWREIDRAERIWTIPAGRRKNREKNASGEPHLIPLTDLHLALLDEIAANRVDESPYLFPSPRDPQRHVPANSLSQALRRWCDRMGVERCQPRDLRRTWKTLAGRAGVDLEIRNRIQGHAMQDVGSRHYDRYDYLDEKAAGMRRWASWLARALGNDGDAGGKVVALEGRAG